MRSIFLFLSLLFLVNVSNSQTTLRVLFLGNSYTSVNDLPQLVYLVSKSAGDSIVYASNTPGGLTLEGHCNNSTSVNLINQGGWDFVVLQEQSQRPAFTDYEVQTYVFPYAEALNNMILAADSCTETMFYMTWGRKNGDATNCAVWPPICTYEGMDSLLHLRYMMMAQDNNAEVSPVGAVWHYLRNNEPTIELYSGDGSHPSVAGSYAAACSFYASLFRKNPENITFDYALSATDAGKIRNAARIVVFDSLAHWYNVDEEPIASFNTSNNGLTVSFTNTSVNSHHSYWTFGDGNNSSEENPEHTYNTANNYTVTLVTEYCGLYDTTTQVVSVMPAGIENYAVSTIVFPNPINNLLNISCGYEILNVCINDIGGRTVSAINNIYQKQVEIDFSSIEDGIYFVQTETTEGIAVNKIIKCSK